MPNEKGQTVAVGSSGSSALREWTLADERNIADRLANALLSGDPMERIDALADYAVQLTDAEAQNVCRVGGVSEAALARARRVDAKMRALPNVGGQPRDEPATESTEKAP